MIFGRNGINLMCAIKKDIKNNCLVTIDFLIINNFSRIFNFGLTARNVYSKVAQSQH